MKKFLVTPLLLLLLITSCSGPEGPMGPMGPEGISVFSNVTEVVVDFTPENNYEVMIPYPSQWRVYEADIVMVYLSYETITDNSGPIQVWRALPQSLLTEQGLLQYNFDHTFKDVRLFMQADYDLGFTTSGDRENQRFKIAVIPAQYGDLLPHLDQLTSEDFEVFAQ